MNNESPIRQAFIECTHRTFDKDMDDFDYFEAGAQWQVRNAVQHAMRLMVFIPVAVVQGVVCLMLGFKLVKTGRNDLLGIVGVNFFIMSCLIIPRIVKSIKALKI